MKKGIHPHYAPVVVRDTSTGTCFVTRSTRTPDQMIEFEGRRLPVLDVDISFASHPFWTGRRRELDSEGRVERYRRRYGQEAPR